MSEPSQWQRMLAGEPYDAADAELTALRRRARALYRRFNREELDKAASLALLDELLGSHGERCHINPPVYCDYGRNIHVGENFYANVNCTLLDVCEIRIGDNVLLAPNVQILTASHPIAVAPRVQGVEFGKPVTLGHNVWVGGGSILCPGVSIGDNSVIGAGSVVTRDIPANVVAVGNPCRVLRPLTEAELAQAPSGA